ncbi:lasso peptide biosynthesis B2 protein [Cognatiluteimonas lumbrici]|uniref:lasso peptide biosynthesis B2 protein n=1 Tax=Cognatiluteimonas lumbrici TaxID=2559601 RepID=UPI00112AB879|nr:lasso peptide biosynthesis B2 protein [Luteimonas lumbrici]
MHYRLRDNLSHCVIGEHAVFLDVEADRYFTLPDPLQRAFLAFAGDRHHAPASPALLASGLLVPTTPADSQDPGVRLESPLRSAREMASSDAVFDAGVILDLLSTVWTCRRQLRRKPLKSVLDSAARYRDLRCVAPSAATARASEQRLLRVARAFLRARRYVPATPCCLPDSLACLRFLARRGLYANIVFGVTYDPFSAHCWVQAGDIALNETVGTAMAHTIIRVL